MLVCQLPLPPWYQSWSGCGVLLGLGWFAVPTPSAAWQWLQLLFAPVSMLHTTSIRTQCPGLADAILAVRIWMLATPLLSYLVCLMVNVADSMFVELMSCCV